jgi:hypothetical protein
LEYGSVDFPNRSNPSHEEALMVSARQVRRHAAWLAAIALIFGCESQPVTGPDGLEPQFAKGGKFKPVPIHFGTEGGFEIDLASTTGMIQNETIDVLEFNAGGGGAVVRTTHFIETANHAVNTEFIECFDKRGQNADYDLTYNEKLYLIGWLVDVQRTGGFGGSINLASLGTPSDGQSLTSRTTDATPNQHVDLAAFPKVPEPYYSEPTVTRPDPANPDVYEFNGGSIQMWDRSGSVPDHLTLQCPNYDTVTLTIGRDP